MNTTPHLTSTDGSAAGFILTRLAKAGLVLGQTVLLQVLGEGARLLGLRGPYNLSSEIGRYLRELKAKGRSPSTLGDAHILFDLIPLAGRNASVVDVEPRHVARLLETRRGNRKTTAIYRNEIAAFFNWFSQSRGVRFNPAIQVNLAKLRSSHPTIIPPAPSRKGTKRLARHLRAKARRLTNLEILRLLFVTIRYRPDALPILLVSLFLGLRPKAEAIPLWEDIDWHHKVWKIHAIHAKTRQGRAVPIPPALFSWLLLLRRDQGPIAHFGYANWKVVRKELFAMANVPFHSDCLRATALSNWLIFNEGDLDTVAKWLGNSPEVAKAVYFDPPTPAQATVFMGLLPPEGWVPRTGYRPAHGSFWSRVASEHVMTATPTLRQWITFFRSAFVKPASSESLPVAA